MQHKPFSPERLLNIRRMRKARRLWKHFPLFAYALMEKEYTNYSYDDFLDDLRRRTKKSRKKDKSPLRRYGRFSQMEQLLKQYGQTKDAAYALQAIQLRERMTKPYKVEVRLDGIGQQYYLSAHIPISSIEQLIQKVRGCKEFQERDKLIQEMQTSNH